MTQNDQNARFVALEMLHRVLHQKQLVDQVQQGMREYIQLGVQDKKFAMAIVMMVLRRLAQVDAVIHRCMEKKLQQKYAKVNLVLRMAIAEMLWLDVPHHAVIHEAVELTKRISKPHAGLVNAVLRRVQREQKEFLQQVVEVMPVPAWLFESWAGAYGEAIAQQIATMLYQEPALDISVKDAPATWAHQLNGEVTIGNNLRLKEVSAPVPQLAGYHEGAWWVQDVAASVPVMLLGDVKGKYVLDACAAPGGKTAQFCAAGAEVVALDRSPQRIARMQENLHRLGYVLPIVEADVMAYQPEGLFDVILLDAPCTATGTLRRNPELVWQKTPDDVADMAAVQAKMLPRVWQMLKVGGRLVYAVCSLQPEEGEAQMKAFMHAEPSAKLVKPTLPQGLPAEALQPDGMVRLLPHFWREKGGMEGFFAAVLEKCELTGR